MIVRSRKHPEKDQIHSYKRIFHSMIYPVLSVIIIAIICLFFLYQGAVIKQISATESDRITTIGNRIHAVNTSIQEMGLRFLKTLKTTRDLYETDRDNMLFNLLTEQERKYVDSIYLYIPGEKYVVIYPANTWRSVNQMDEEELAATDARVIDLIRNYDQYYRLSPMLRTASDESRQLTYILPLFTLAKSNYNPVMVVNISSEWINSLIDLPGGYAFVLDGSNDIISTNTGLFKNEIDLYGDLHLGTIQAKQSATGSFFGNYHGEKSLFLFHAPEWGNWKIVDIIPINKICPELNRMLVLSIAICMLGVALSVLLDYLLSKQVFAPISKAYVQLQNIENQSKSNQYRLKQEYLHAICSGMVSFDHSDREKALQMLDFSIDTDRPFTLIGIGIAEKTIAEIREPILNIIMGRECELYEINSQEAMLICQPDSMEISQIADSVARLILAFGWLAVSSQFDAWEQFSKAVRQMKSQLAFARFWQISRGRVALFKGKESIPSKISDNGKKLMEAIQNRSKEGACGLLEQVIYSGSEIDYAVFRSFLVHLAFEVTFTVRSIPGLSKEEESQLQNKIGNQFIHLVENADTVEEVYLLFSDAIRSIPDNASNRGHSAISTAVCQKVQQQYTNPNLSITSIAEEIGLSGNYVSRIFQSQIGISFTNYLIEVRIKAACDLLTTTDQPVEMIAELVGISNTKYFYSLFKKVMNMTPREYRLYRLGLKSNKQLSGEEQ